MPRILSDKEEGTSKIKLMFFADSTSICSHKPQSDRRIWNFHVLVSMVHPNYINNTHSFSFFANYRKDVQNNLQIEN